MSKDIQSDNKKPGLDFYFFIKNLLSENGLDKELRHLPKFVYFVFLIFKNQKAQSTFVPISNRLLKKVIRQEIITRLKKHLLTLGVVECDYTYRFKIDKG